MVPSSDSHSTHNNQIYNTQLQTITTGTVLHWTHCINILIMHSGMVLFQVTLVVISNLGQVLFLLPPCRTKQKHPRKVILLLLPLHVDFLVQDQQSSMPACVWVPFTTCLDIWRKHEDQSMRACALLRTMAIIVA